MYPNFIVIGAQRSGTTALDRYFRQHPDICLSHVRKELAHFVVMKTKNVPFEDYQEFFVNCQPNCAIGDVSPQYLYFPYVAEMIAVHLPNVKLIASLRNPIDRAYSAYCYNMMTGREPNTFEQTFDQNRRALINDYLGAGDYVTQIETYLKFFPREQLKIIRFENLIAEPQAVLRELCGYLQVDPDFEFSTIEKSSQGANAARYPRFPALQRGLAWTRFRMYKLRFLWRFHTQITPIQARLPYQSSYPPMSEATRERLRVHYQPMVARLSDLLEQDFSDWLA